MVTVLHPVPLTSEAFSSYGEVIDWRLHDAESINQGTAEKFADLATVDVGDGEPALALYRAQPRSFPLEIELLEAHPLASQAFVPLADLEFLVVVALNEPATERPRLETLRVFRTAGGQGVNFAPGIWHHPLLAIDRVSDFLVVDRKPDGVSNYVESRLSPPCIIERADLEAGEER